MTILWEITRRVLVWYYSILPRINLIYGSFATAVVALLTIDAVALILLLGAHVIAELERKTDELTREKLSDFETRISVMFYSSDIASNHLRGI